MKALEMSPYAAFSASLYDLCNGTNKWVRPFGQAAACTMQQCKPLPTNGGIAWKKYESSHRKNVFFSHHYVRKTWEGFELFSSRRHSDSLSHSFTLIQEKHDCAKCW